MNPQVKLGLYVVTVIGSLVFGILFVHSWRRVGIPAPPQVAAAGTNAPVKSTNEPAPASAELTPERESVESTPSITAQTRGLGRLILWGLLGVGAVAGLGTLIAYDVSNYAGHRATQALFDDEGEELPESLDEQVEKAHGAGDFLEAIRLLRDHLKESPRAVHAQIRIAEIYEKDLNNPLAAALEYEEVIQRPLPSDRRGWAAVHLVNLYNRLNKPDQAIAMLQRVVLECPDTPAAAKARERLESAGIAVPEPPPSATGSAGGDAEPPSNLPPGFRKR